MCVRVCIAPKGSWAHDFGFNPDFIDWYAAWCMYDMNISDPGHDFWCDGVLYYNHLYTEVYDAPCARHNQYTEGPSYSAGERQELIVVIDEALDSSPLYPDLANIVCEYVGLKTPCWFHGPATPYIVVATEKRRAQSHVDLYCPIQHHDTGKGYMLPIEIPLDDYNQFVAEVGVAKVRVLTRTKINAKQCLPLDCVSDSESDGTHSPVVLYSHVLLAVDWGDDGVLSDESDFADMSD